MPWDINKFITEKSKVFQVNVLAGLKKEKDRVDIIAYLKEELQ